MPDRLPLILVCDDTPAKRYVISSWLRRDGYRVIETDTAAEARRLIGEEPIDLAVLDVHLPDGSGLEITRDLRDDPDRSATPVVHVSAVAMETLDKVAGLDSGADAYFVDPIEPQELLSTIRALLRTSGARRDAEELAGRMSRLNRAAVRLNLASTIARLSNAVASAAGEVLNEPAVAVLVDGEVGRHAAAAPGGTVDSIGTLAADVTRTLVSGLVAGLVDGVDGANSTEVRATEAPWTTILPQPGPSRWRLGLVSVFGEPVGLVAVPTSSSAGSDHFLLDRLSQLTAVAFDNVRTLEREHQTAVLLQRSLLPATLPQVAGLSFAARYRASELHAEVGGDFFDAFEVDDGCFIAIGDVQGHSLDAAVVMAELRYSMRAYGYDGYGPAGVMDRIDAVLTRTEPGLIATACIALVDADRRAMRVVSAGHPPMILVRDGAATITKLKGILLGLASSHREYVVELRPGDRLLLFTDGLVESRSEPLDDSLQRVADTVAGWDETDTEKVADQVLAEFGASDDDVALLVVDVRSSQ